MAFTMPSYPLLNPQQSSPYANLVNNALQSYGTAVQAKYAPQMAQADIFNKEFMPLAQIASSPLAIAMLPEQKQQMANLISQLLQQTGVTGGMGGGNTGGGGLFGGNQSSTSGGQFGGQPSSTSGGSPMVQGGMVGSSSQTPQVGNQASPGYNPSIPQAGGDIGKGATAKVTAPYSEQVHGAGVSFFDPNTGKFYSQPSESTVSVSQRSIGAIKRVIPQLQDISKESQEFLQPGGTSGTIFSQVAGKVANLGIIDRETIKKFGIDPDKYSRYLKWRGDISQALDSLMTSFPNLPTSDLSLKTMASIVEPHAGESSQGYATRVMQTAARLQNEQLPALQQQLTPIPINGEGQSNQITDYLMNSPEAKNEGMAQVNLSQGAKKLSQSMQLPQFESKKAFQDWFNRQPKMVQDAVRHKLGNG
jgi:hypothetical protein